jgi:hypothetical protein
MAPQVRQIGRLLGVPEQFIKRHPFPGPGLAVRVLGDVTEGDKMTVLREVDEIYVNTIKEFGLYDEIWQVCGMGGPWILPSSSSSLEASFLVHRINVAGLCSLSPHPFRGGPGRPEDALPCRCPTRRYERGWHDGGLVFLQARVPARGLDPHL